jgi:prefoldin beta subunit
MTNKQAEQLLAQAQLYQQQMQSLLTQRNAYNLEMAELKQAAEELDKTKEKNVYKISGPILIRHDASEIKDQLEDRLKFLEMRLKVVSDQEDKVKKKIEELREKLLGKDDIKVK